MKKEDKVVKVGDKVKYNDKEYEVVQLFGKEYAIIESIDERISVRVKDLK